MNKNSITHLRRVYSAVKAFSPDLFGKKVFETWTRTLSRPRILPYVWVVTLVISVVPAFVYRYLK